MVARDPDKHLQKVCSLKTEPWTQAEINISCLAPCCLSAVARQWGHCAFLLLLSKVWLCTVCDVLSLPADERDCWNNPESAQESCTAACTCRFNGGTLFCCFAPTAPVRDQLPPESVWHLNTCLISTEKAYLCTYIFTICYVCGIVGLMYSDKSTGIH